MSTVAKGDAFEDRVFQAIKKEVELGKLGLLPASCSVYRKKGYYSRDRDKEIVLDVSIERFQEPPIGRYFGRGNAKTICPTCLQVTWRNSGRSYNRLAGSTSKADSRPQRLSSKGLCVSQSQRELVWFVCSGMIRLTGNSSFSLQRRPPNWVSSTMPTSKEHSRTKHIAGKTELSTGVQEIEYLVTGCRC